ncbi:MAG: hypothetical protein LDL51_07085 [Chloroflexi bacterium]|nr:hypothetical protein [Chloroflexota bacterium]
MKRKESSLKIYFLIAFAFMSLFFSGVVYAASNDITVDVVRLRGTYVGVKIALDTDVSGEVMGMLAGKGFNCVVAPSNVVYCIGPFRTDSGPAKFFLIDKDTKEVIFEKILYPPKTSGSGDEEQPTPPPPSPVEELPPGPSGDEPPVDELPSS